MTNVFFKYLAAILFCTMQYLSRILIAGSLFTKLSCGYFNVPDVHDKVPHQDFCEYYLDCDTVIDKEDTTIIVSKKFDTTIIHAGVFSYLRYDYPCNTGQAQRYYAEHAAELEKQGDADSARYFYRLLIDYRMRRQAIDDTYYSDTDDYFTVGIHTAILYSYAYEKLGNLNESVAVVTPFIATDAVDARRVQQWYIKQCILKYGKKEVIKAIEGSAMSIQRKTTGLPQGSYWVVNILGADMGIAGDEKDKVTPQQAARLIRQSNWYKYAKAMAEKK